MANAEYSIDHAVIADILKNDTAVFAALFAIAEDATEFWKSVAPVNKTGLPHTLTSGYVDEPGSYRDSVRMRMIKNPTRMKARVEAADYKSFWLEGIKNINLHNPDPPEPMYQTLAHLMSMGLPHAGEISPGD